ncbi:class I SAM-dependent methyltransferase [Pseudomonas sp.]|uniref:class I SAM-dependent methyltransferase n=1 Tax=Pseudomonas sp. TaxID=306 RepID=UPI002E31AEAD|nr:class I SAM-dependent methyltransferase [Pseudomonas sp.]HEX4548143.1 class I SAM-dependent methyltransferase [Pseudomonas sp.]
MPWGNTTEEYLTYQRQFFNAPTAREARLDLVDSVSRTEEDYQRLAEIDLSDVFKGIAAQADWRILEIGCGAARLLSLIEQRIECQEIAGIDIAPNMLVYAKQILGPGTRVTLTVCDGKTIPLKSSFLDFVFANAVFIHIADSKVVISYLREVRRVLRRGGLFRFNVRRM